MKISAMKNYNPPTFPSIAEARENPVLLKNVPSRWKKKAAAFACAGIMGMSIFSGYGGAKFNAQVEDFIIASENANETARERLDTAALTFRAHYGGTGFGPFYVAYITEQEAFGFIREQLESAGLNFDYEIPSPFPTPTPTPPPWEPPFPMATPIPIPPPVLPRTISIFCPFWGDQIAEIGFDLFDGERNVAVSHVAESKVILRMSLDWFAREASRVFAQMDNGITAGVIYSSNETVLTTQEYWNLFGSPGTQRTEEEQRLYVAERNALLTERGEEVRQALITDLEEQIQAFIDSLHEKGILHNAPRIILGDVDGDGRITSADATLLARYLAGHFDHMDEPPLCLTAADINGDGDIGTAVLVKLVRMLVGLE